MNYTGMSSEVIAQNHPIDGLFAYSVFIDILTRMKQLVRLRQMFSCISASAN